MRRRKLGTISENEAKRRKVQREKAPPSYVSLKNGTLSAVDLDPVGSMSVGALNAVLVAQPPPLLHTRAQASRLLNCSVATLQRLEKSGTLSPIKLNKQSPAAQVYYAHEQLLALARVS